eukprot:CAMPEP_0182816324 /NCGR_PEP_ID=MMETSP0006_2-20121128/10874_1 /TAXON_ID=97485 /ORGANISM="Prymnesium parvum, Strain Texoma1" /LENGTH=294 /DNA_ID=CAMNT_0024942603 /DNA_START=883 /DNA_END=1768 /DNA_ORIENTATION=-
MTFLHPHHHPLCQDATAEHRPWPRAGEEPAKVPCAEVDVAPKSARDDLQRLLSHVGRPLRSGVRESCSGCQALQRIAKAIDDGDRRPPSQTHEKRDAHGIPIGELTELARLRVQRVDEASGATDPLGGQMRDATLQLWRLPCQPHVCQLRVAESVEKDVGRLDVAVEHSTPCRQRRVQVHEGARRVTNGAHSLLRRRGLCLALHNGGLKLHISSTFRCAALSSVVTKRLDEDARNHRPIAWRVVRLAPGECVGRGDIEVVVRLDAEKTLVVGCVALILVVVEVDGHRNRSVIER